MTVVMAAIVVAPKTVAVKMAGQPTVAAAKGMVVDGQVARGTHPADGRSNTPAGCGKK